MDAEDPAGLERLTGMDGVLSLSRAKGVTEVVIDDVGRVPDLVGALTAAGVRLTRVDPHVPTLEELYFAVRAERRSQGVEDML
jgi:hypothetical protein